VKPLIALGIVGIFFSLQQPIISLAQEPSSASPVPAASTAPLISSAAGEPIDQSGSGRVIVPGGTPLGVRLAAPLSSGSAHVNDEFRFQANENVVVAGWVVIAKDAVGSGIVTDVDAAGTHGHAGQIKLEYDWIYGVDGKKIRLSTVPSTGEGANEKGTASMATVVSTILLGPVGLFAHNFVKGQEATMDTSKIISVYVADTVHINANQQALDEYAH
jgi:hypothetical protein